VHELGLVLIAGLPRDYMAVKSVIMLPMVRTQIQLTEEQSTAVRELARREQRSMADLVRESIEARLRQPGFEDREGLKRRAIAVIGRFRSGVADLGSQHDRYAAESFEG
jgi:predicted DNA-binding protein